MVSKHFLKDFLRSQGIPSYRIEQIFNALYREGKSSYEEMNVLPDALKNILKEHCPIFSFTVGREVISKTADTVKTLFQLKDSQCIEGVLMRFSDGRNSVCVSSQVGCGLRCTFCATGTMGFLRNLTAEEITDQVLYFDQWLKNNKINSSLLRAHSASAKRAKNLAQPVLSEVERKNKVTNVIFMGMGEPFLNYDAVMESVRGLNDSDSLGIAARHITISTSGVIPGIERLAKEKIQVNLAVSLHAPTQDLREKLMPIAKPYPVLKLMEAVKRYITKTHRRVSYEYVMLRDINDTPELAKKLGELVHGQLCHINLIPYNQTYLGFQNAGKSRIDRFREIVESYDIPTTVRVSLGQDISAACGQLAVKKME